MAKSWSERWDRIKTDVTLLDLVADSCGKVLVALGIGVILGPQLGDAAAICAFFLIGAGFPLVFAVKTKYWKRFWGA